MIDDATYTALREHAMGLPNLANFTPDGAFIRFADDWEIVNAATTSLEGTWHIEIDTGEFNTDDVRGIVEAYKETHITAAG